MTDILFTEEDLKFYLYGKQHSDFDSNCSAFLSPLVPRQVCIRRSTIPGAFHGVFSKVWIRRGTEMGPYTGRMCGAKEVNEHSNTWEVLDDRGEVIYYVDGGPDSNPTSWLSCVQCARTDREQNLEITQTNRHIFYRAIKDIPPGEELLVWYAQTSVYHMGLPLTSHNTGEIDRNKVLPPCQQNAADHVDKLRCVLCRRAFNSRSNLRSHMRIHTMEKPFSCKFCNKCFSQSSTLRNHVRLHTGERPYKCFVCRSSYSQLAGLRAHQRSARHKPIVATKQTGH